MVHGLEKDYAGKLKFAIRGYQEGDSQQRIKDYGLDVHGMVITDQTGKKHWMESGHKQTRPVVEAAIKSLLGG